MARESTRQLLLSLGLLVLAAAVLGGIIVTLVPRNGAELPDLERTHLLEQAGLPADFPVHPYARRMSQPDQGGFTYALREPVPDVLSWQRLTLITSGYEVFNADVQGQDEYLPRWLYFTSSTGASGAIIIRASGRGIARGTEVKVLSRSDSRLAPPTAVPAAPPRPPGR